MLHQKKSGQFGSYAIYGHSDKRGVISIEAMWKREEERIGRGKALEI